MDALFAELLSMGFEMKQIERCRERMTLSSTPFNLQTATEWLLDSSASSCQHTTRSSNTLVLTSPSRLVPENVTSQTVHKPLSPSRNLSDVSCKEPLTSRYNLGAAHTEGKERFAAKEREEAVKKARERRKEDMRAKDLLRRELEADKRARAIKDHKTAGTTPTSSSNPLVEATPNLIYPEPSVISPSDTCRLQVRLPSGRVLRNVFPSSALLNDVISFITSSDVSCSVVSLIQPYPRHEYTSDEGHSTLESLGLCPSATLVISSQPNTGRGVVNVERPVVPEPMDVQDERNANRDMEQSDSDSSMEDENPPPPIRHNWPMGQPRFNPFVPGLVAEERFGGTGHRLGGKEMSGDSNSIRIQKALVNAKTAALQREHRISSPAPPPSSVVVPLPSLCVLCIRVLISHSSKYGMPSCSTVPPVLAQQLLAALKEGKKLNSKTMAAFYGCPLSSINLDNYSNTTNELLLTLSHFPSLVQFSMTSCILVTDSAMTDMFPYLSRLTSVRLNGCTQLSQAIFRSLRGCKGLEVLELSQVKVNDEGLRQLLYYPLQNLRELDLSYTQVTARGLEFLPEGAPLLEKLSLELTPVTSYSPLSRLHHLRSLNLSRCQPPYERDLGELRECRCLEVLSLSGMALYGNCLEQLRGSKLKSLKLPERNLFFDVAMETVSELPLTSLNLTDYLHVTDAGISSLAKMTSLTSLSLSRTKLTDVGMPFLEGLYFLTELCLDNCVITDGGIIHIAGLTELEVLSLSDTMVTSQFILDGVMTRMRALIKLNLSRTAVCDRGVKRLALPSLTMLNLDWTCITEAITIPMLRDNGCPVLETLRNRNICQPLPREDMT